MSWARDSDCRRLRVARPAGQEVLADESMPSTLPIAVDPDCDESDHRGEGARVDGDRIAVAASINPERLYVQYVVPALEHATVFVASDGSGVVINLDDLDRVPIGGDDMEGEQPGGPALAGADGIGTSVQCGHAEKAAGHIEE